MAVKSPVQGSTVISAFSPFSEQNEPFASRRLSGAQPSMTSVNNNGYLAAPSSNSDPSRIDVSDPTSAISQSSIGTDFTDLEGIEEKDAPASTKQQNLARLKSPTERSPDLKIETHQLPLHNILNEPQSVIHIPSGFGSFGREAPAQRLPQRTMQMNHRLSASSFPSQQSVSEEEEEDEEEEEQEDEESITPAHEETSATPQRPSTGVSLEASSEAPSSNATVTTEAQLETGPPQKAHGSMPVSPPPITTSIPMAPSDRGTPRAQTRSELLSRPPSSLASIAEGDDSDNNDAGDEASNDLDPLRKASTFLHDTEAEIQALKTALSECWTLCNTLASLSSIHRERIFNFSGKGDMQEQAWKACWKLCQNLYDARDDYSAVYVRPTLDLCRDFCSALFEVRVRDNETADSVLRVSFELNNHLFNTHDRSLPETFRERTLDFYITLCHRLMKQKSRLPEETDSLLKACWSLAEMLFSLRQNKREGRVVDVELLGSAVQACWELCDLFREGWTQIRPERGTPQPSQTTFTQAFQQARRTGFSQADETPQPKGFPETPTTIFEDVNSGHTLSPEEQGAPIPSFSIMNAERQRLLQQRQYQPRPQQQYPLSAVSSQLMSIDSPMSATTFATSSSVASTPLDDPAPNPFTRGRPPSLTGSNNFSRNNHANANMTVPRSWSMASSARSPAPSDAGVSVANTATTRTTRTTNTITRQTYAQAKAAEDPTLVLLKTLFVRAAVQTGQGYDRNSPNPLFSNLHEFVKRLPNTAFGSQSWQTSLIENYKKAITGDPGFQNIPAHLTTIAGQKSAIGGPVEVARAVQGMVKSVYGFGWLRDLYRFVFGVYLEEILQGNGSQRAVAIRVAQQSQERKGPGSVTGSMADPPSASSAGGMSRMSGSLSGRRVS